MHPGYGGYRIMNKMKTLTGISVVPGKGVGAAFFVGRALKDTNVVTIPRQNVGDEIMRFNEIREQAKKEYHEMIQNSDSHSFDTSILHIYIHILDDPAFIGQVMDSISGKLYDVKTAIRLVSNDFIKRFNAAGTSYFKERSSDMVEICEKLISATNADDGRAKGFPEPVVLIVPRMFSPSDILAYDRSKVRAIVTAGGGKTSHGAILARSYSIPLISGIKNIAEQILPNQQVYVDADEGKAYLNPTQKTEKMFKIAKKVNARYKNLKNKWDRPAYTKDGINVKVFANVSLPDDVDVANEYGSDGIGLVRTEYLLSNRKKFPEHKIQYEYYKGIFDKNGKKPITIRLMDIGGDKTPDFFDMPREYNPFMGWRGVRIFHEHPEFLESQVTAIMEAGKNKDYSIMVPMITTRDEWTESKTRITDVAKKQHQPMPKVGALLEVPLAVLEIESFLRDMDFASIGTNDLIQYLSAADRNNSKVNFLYNPIEPAFLRIVRTAIAKSGSYSKPISLCGEMAGDPKYTALLLGLGLRRFSVIPKNIPIIKELISHISFREASEHVSHSDAVTSTKDISSWLEDFNYQLFGDLIDSLQA